MRTKKPEVGLFTTLTLPGPKFGVKAHAVMGYSVLMKAGRLVAARFKVLELARSGGMGAVYVARDEHTGERVALKLVKAQEASVIDRFQREARVLAGLEHPAIVQYLAHGRTEESGESGLFLAMEWLEGEDLAARLERGPLSVAESAAVASRVASALAWAHERGVVHRDVKPSNIFLRGGRVDDLKVLDFGLARLASEAANITGTDVVMGTPAYMAPEQARGAREADPRADVFALGCVLFECLTGRRPFLGEHPMAILAKILFEEVPRVGELEASVPADLEALVMRMLAKDPDARPRDGREVLQAVGCIDIHDEKLGPMRRPARLSGREQRLVSVVIARSRVASGDTRGAKSAPTSAGSAQPEDTLRRVVAPFGGQIEWLGNDCLAVALSVRGSAPDQAVHAARCALALRGADIGAPLVVATGRGLDAAGRLPIGEAIDRAVRLLRETTRNEDTHWANETIILDDVTSGLLDRRFEVLPRPDIGGAELQAEHELEVARTVLGKATPCVGRDRDIANLLGIFEECMNDGVARAVIVTAAAGVGKSRLRQEFLRTLSEAGHHVETWIARGDPISAGSPFSMIAPGIRRTAGIVQGEPIERARTKLRARIGRHVSAAEVERVAVFVGELVGVPFPEHQHVQLREARRDALLMGDQMRRAWEDLLAAECASGPVLMVLEDLHWGDLPSVKFIDSVLRNLREQPVMVMALARPDVHELFPGLWHDRGVQEIRLGELTRRACQALIRAVRGEDVRPEIVAALAERSNGNAFYLEELIRAEAEGAEELPATVIAMVQARLQGLPDELRRVLRAASAFGELFWGRGVASLLGGSSAESTVNAALEALAVRELIGKRADRKFPDEDEYMFRHDLVREAAYSTLTEADRVLAHRLAGEWLERKGEREALVLAEHFERGAEPGRAALWYQRSAEHALDGNDFGHAVARAERAAALGAEGQALAALRELQAIAHLWEGQALLAAERGLEAATHYSRESIEWLRAMGTVIEARGHLGHYDDVEGCLREVAALELSAQGRAMQIECLARGALLLVYAGRTEASSAFLQTLEEYALREERLDSRTKGRLEYLRGTRALQQGDVAYAFDALAAACDEFREAGDERAVCMAQIDLGYACTQLGLYDRSHRELQDALSTAQGMGLQPMAAAALQNLGIVISYCDSASSRNACELEERAAHAFQSQGNPRMEGAAWTYLAIILHQKGDYVAAETNVRRALQILDAIPPMRAFALAVHARILLAQSRAEDALPLAVEGMDLLDSLGGLDEGEALVRLAYAQALRANGRIDEARQAAMRARGRLLERAAKIERAEWRQSFLENIPENAETLALTFS